MKQPKFSIKITEDKPIVCYEIYGIVTLLFVMITIGLLGWDHPALATLTSLPAMFAVWRIIEIARGRAWK